MKKAFIDQLKTNLELVLPESTSVIDALSELLNTSKESVYRRFRGETSFTLEELILIREKHKISLDALFDIENTAQVSFRSLYSHEDAFMKYMLDINDLFNDLRLLPDTKLLNAAENLPFFRHLAYPHLANFKKFYWQRSVMHRKEFQNKLFSIDNADEETTTLHATLSDQYNQTESVEIWTANTLVGTLTILEYYHTCGMVDTNTSLEAVYSDIKNLAIDLLDQAKNGYKTLSNGEVGGKFTLFLCELTVDNNGILLLSEEKPRYAAIGFNAINSLQSTNSLLLEECHVWYDAIIQKSVKVSGASERIRLTFFNNMIRLINESSLRSLGKVVT
ncbi:MAG: hypothetical protein ACI8ZN_001888 [Bacteroidia bacterium]|jgi:hypothetical protein